MIAGLEEVTQGRISIGGSDVTELAPRHRDIAMVFQSYALYPHMSVRQNIGYGLKVRRMPKAEVARRVEEVAALLGLEELLDRRPAQLSGGQRQRVAMGRAIVREPKAFLMDEPLSNLDAKLRVGMRASLAQLHARLGVTTVYVTHDQVEAMTLGQRVAVMRDGPDPAGRHSPRLYEHPANLFVAAFIGSPAMNLVEATIDGDEVAFGGPRAARPARRPPRGTAASSSGSGRRLRGRRFARAELPTIDGRAEVLEDLGSDAHVFFRVDAPPITAEMLEPADEEAALLPEAGAVQRPGRPRTRARVGEPLELAVDPGAAPLLRPRERRERSCRTPPASDGAALASWPPAAP